jgi:FKBP-type peptidyl-prolyl cis-trans isomerase FkpA
MYKLVLIFGALLLSAIASAQSDLEKEKQLSSEYLAKVALEPKAQVIEGGVVLRPLFVSDTSRYPTVADTVIVSYHLSDREGKLIEESLSEDEAFAFPLPRLIKCWQYALPKIAVGSFYKITCPSDTAYGDKGTKDGSIKGGAAITFRVTLFGVQTAQ